MKNHTAYNSFSSIKAFKDLLIALPVVTGMAVASHTSFAQRCRGTSGYAPVNCLAHISHE